MTRSSLLLVFLAAPALFAACHPDPVHSDAVSAQGPEDPGVPPGPLHRPGQPCLVCHADRGPASMVLSLAGTIYKQGGNARDPLPNAIVRVTDSKGRTVSTGTNCAGNFFIQKQQFDPAWPVWVQLEFGGHADPHDLADLPRRLV